MNALMGALAAACAGLGDAVIAPDLMSFEGGYECAAREQLDFELRPPQVVASVGLRDTPGPDNGRLAVVAPS